VSQTVLLTSLPGTPASQGADLLQTAILIDESSTVELVDVQHRIASASRLEIEVRVDTDDPEEAQEVAVAWIKEVCRNAREWRQECGIRFFDDELREDSEDDESTEIGDLFDVAVAK
jgi:hypothetical protein